MDESNDSWISYQPSASTGFLVLVGVSLGTCLAVLGSPSRWRVLQVPRLDHKVCLGRVQQKAGALLGVCSEGSRKNMDLRPFFLSLVCDQAKSRSSTGRVGSRRETPKTTEFQESLKGQELWYMGRVLCRHRRPGLVVGCNQ